ncbi:ubiquitin-specific protease [Trifolium repens]|nr:ubiquitin-specific protease [Trifolium repens]
MEHQESNGEIFEKITWKIANFSQLNIGFTIYSEPFVLGGYPWRIYFFRKGSKKDGNLSIFLEAARMKIVIVSKGCSNNVSKGCLSKEWSRDVKFKLVVFNQLDTNKTITKEFNHKFNESAESFGYEYFISLAELNDPEKGFIVKDVLIVSAEVFVFKSTHDEPVIGSSPTYVSQAGDMVVEVPRQIPEVELGPMKDSIEFVEMKHGQSSVEKFEKFTWKIKNFSRLNTNEAVCSEPFVLFGYPWRICLYPRGYKVDNYLSIFLEAVKTANMSKGWSRDVKFKLLVFNQLNTNMTITKDSSREFNASVKSWGYRSFLT